MRELLTAAQRLATCQHDRAILLDTADAAAGIRVDGRVADRFCTECNAFRVAGGAWLRARLVEELVDAYPHAVASAFEDPSLPETIALPRRGPPSGEFPSFDAIRQLCEEAKRAASEPREVPFVTLDARSVLGLLDEVVAGRRTAGPDYAAKVAVDAASAVRTCARKLAACAHPADLLFRIADAEGVQILVDDHGYEGRVYVCSQCGSLRIGESGEWEAPAFVEQLVDEAREADTFAANVAHAEANAPPALEPPLHPALGRCPLCKAQVRGVAAASGEFLPLRGEDQHADGCLYGTRTQTVARFEASDALEPDDDPAGARYELRIATERLVAARAAFDAVHGTQLQSLENEAVYDASRASARHLQAAMREYVAAETRLRETQERSGAR